MSRCVPISYRHTVVDGGFWQSKQDMVRKDTLPCIYERFVESGRFSVFEFDWNPERPYKPHQFWDSDIAKWMESAAYLLAKEDELEQAKALYKRFMKQAVSLGGTISAEHGVGKLKKKYLDLLYGKNGIEEMKKVKIFFDPKNLFNKFNLIDL